MNLRFAAAGGLLVLATAACSSNATNFGGEPDDGTDAAPSLVLRLEYEGGFMPAEYTFTAQPTLVVMSDGRIYSPPAMIEIYPPPIQTGYEVRRVTQEGVAAIRERADEAGLTEDGDRAPNEDGMAVADAATTVFTYVDEDGTEHRITAYALAEYGTDGDTPERRKLLEFQRDLTDLASWLPEGAIVDEGSVEPVAAMRIGVIELETLSGPTSVGDGGDAPLEPNQEPQPWPLDPPLASFGSASDDDLVERCGVLTGADLGTFLEAAESANTMTPWLSEGKPYRLLYDPLTPDEATTC